MRVIRSIVREPPRPKPRRSISVEVSSRQRRRSESRSETSVRFDLPPRTREPRKYRILNYDGESGPYRAMSQSPSGGGSESTEVRARPSSERQRTSYRETESRGRDSHHSDTAHGVEFINEQVILPRHRPSMRRIEAPLPQLAFATGARGRSLSSERRASSRDDPNRHERRRRGRSWIKDRGSRRYSTSSDVSIEQEEAGKCPCPVLSGKGFH